VWTPSACFSQLLKCARSRRGLSNRTDDDVMALRLHRTPTRRTKRWLTAILGLVVLLPSSCRQARLPSWHRENATGFRIRKRGILELLPRQKSGQRTLWIPESADRDVAERRIWVRRPGAARWTLLATVPPQPESVVALPGEGSWEIFLSGDGPSAQPSSDRADVVIVVDETPPNIGHFSVQLDEDADQVNVQWRADDTSFGRIPASLEVSTDRGASWTILARELAHGIRRLRVGDLGALASDDDTRVHLRLRIVDEMGNESTSGKVQIYPRVGDFPRLVAPEFTNKSPVVVEYSMESVSANQIIELWATSDGGKIWRLVTVDEDRESPVEFEANDGRHGLRMVVRDPDGDQYDPARSDTLPMATVVVDTQPPEVVVKEAFFAASHGEGADGKHAAQLSVEASDDGLAELERLVVFGLREGGSSLEALAEFAPLDEIEFEVSTEDAGLELFLVAFDRAGNHSPMPEPNDAPHAVVSLGAPSFAVEVLSPSAAAMFAGGSAVEILMRTIQRGEEGQPVGMSLFFSVDNGNTWQTLAKGVPFSERRSGIGGHLGNEPVVTNKSFPWEIPTVTSETCRLRVDAWDERGLRSRFVTDPFAIDSSAPVARIVRAENMGDGQLLLNYECEPDTPAGLAQVWLCRLADGEQWQRLEPALPPQDPWLLHVPACAFGFLAVAEDRVGNRLPPPGADTESHVWAQGADVESSALTLKNFHGGMYRGGDRHYVFWEYGGPDELIEDGSFEFSFSRDGESWESVGEAVDVVSRKLAWTLPKLEGEYVRCQLRARLKIGVELRAISSSPFLIESRVPRVTVTGPDVSSSNRVEVSFIAESSPPASRTTDESITEQAAGGVSIARVDCYAAREGEDEWFLAGTWQDQQVMHVDGTVMAHMRDGRYRLALIATDGVGNISASDPAEADVGARLLVDTVRPQLRAEVLDRRDIYTGGEEIHVKILAVDPHLTERPVSLVLYRERGPDPDEIAETLEPYFVADGVYVFKVPPASGIYTLEIVAVDLARNQSRQESTFFVVPPRPEIQFITFTEETSVRGGEHAEVRWETQVHSAGSADHRHPSEQRRRTELDGARNRTPKHGHLELGSPGGGPSGRVSQACRQK
jgi:hypothetical protein